MLNRQLFEVVDGMNRCADIKGLKFSEILSENKDKVEAEIKRIYAFVTDDPEFEKFEQERILTAQAHAKKSRGQYEMENGNYVIKNEKYFKKAMDKLREKHSKAVKKREKELEKMNKEFDKECTIKFKKITKKDLPKDITPRQLEIISTFMYDKK